MSSRVPSTALHQASCSMYIVRNTVLYHVTLMQLQLFCSAMQSINTGPSRVVSGPPPLFLSSPLLYHSPPPFPPPPPPPSSLCAPHPLRYNLIGSLEIWAVIELSFFQDKRRASAWLVAVHHRGSPWIAAAGPHLVSLCVGLRRLVCRLAAERPGCPALLSFLRHAHTHTPITLLISCWHMSAGEEITFAARRAASGSSLAE